MYIYIRARLDYITSTFASTIYLLNYWKLPIGCTQNKHLSESLRILHFTRNARRTPREGGSNVLNALYAYTTDSTEIRSIEY